MADGFPRRGLTIIKRRSRLAAVHRLCAGLCAFEPGAGLSVLRWQDAETTRVFSGLLDVEILEHQLPFSEPVGAESLGDLPLSVLTLGDQF